MTKISATKFAMAAAALLCCGAGAHAADRGDEGQLARVVDETIRPLMKENGVPGMAVAVTARGKRYIFNYGLASKASGQKVTDETLFEIGSISKTFTATLASYAEARGDLVLSDPAGKYLPALAGTSFDEISLLDLGTYAAGGLPLQFPDSVADQKSMIDYYRGWRPTYAAGTYRRYSNPSIGLFGYLAAKSMGEPFADLMEKRIFPALGLTSTFIAVPQDRLDDYAYGYSKAGKPIRVTRGVLDSEAYGVKTTAADLIRVVEANMDGTSLDETIRRAIAATHTGYFKVGAMTQGLGWEIYSYPTKLDDLLAGNSSQMALEPHKVTRLVPPAAPRENVWINKTGSTNGFGAYAAFVPAERIGIVMLANRNCPIPARVKAAYRILSTLESDPGSADAR
ncbi:class C beta-lactamase [Sinorhizobium meliloti]|uniref:Beta-lactamase n=1 Tax=Rhizobium meliloti TaxID=382 RepID=A0A2J0Z798_RHIML|nr:class C beta-lactamase [Sinorhizobium meliloti]PJR16387.1 class C beta-lactamase [Sinorhizobium meliloti]